MSPSANAPAAPETFVDWNAPVPPYESLLLIACHRPDPANPGVCLECIDDPAWALHDGRCGTLMAAAPATIEMPDMLLSEPDLPGTKPNPPHTLIVCAVGAGTHLTANQSAAGWNTTPPAPRGGCQDRELHPGLSKGDYGPLSCDATNPRVLEAIFIDPPSCVCRPCPDGFTSDGGNPAQAACFLAAGPLQAFGVSFGIEEKAPAAGGRRRALMPVDVLDAANELATKWAQVLSHVPESLLGALEPIGDFTLDGPVGSLETLSFSDQEGPYLFSARYVFHASEASRNAVVEAINGVLQDPAFTCASWIAYAGVDMCALVRETLPPGFKLVNPWAKTLPAALDALDGRLMQSFSTGAHRELFVPVLLSGVMTFASKAFTSGGKGFDQFAKYRGEGKGRWASLKAMNWEGRSLVLDSGIQIFGMVAGIVGWATPNEPDKYLPYLKQIDEVRNNSKAHHWEV